MWFRGCFVAGAELDVEQKVHFSHLFIIEHTCVQHCLFCKQSKDLSWEKPDGTAKARIHHTRKACLPTNQRTGHAVHHAALPAEEPGLSLAVRQVLKTVQ